MWTERRLPSSAGAGSGSRPASFARISSQCAGMITKSTFAAMIVPSIAPTCSHAACAAKRFVEAHAATAMRTTSMVPSTSSFFTVRQSTS